MYAVMRAHSDNPSDNDHITNNDRMRTRTVIQEVGVRLNVARRDGAAVIIERCRWDS